MKKVIHKSFPTLFAYYKDRALGWYAEDIEKYCKTLESRC